MRNLSSEGCCVLPRSSRGRVGHPDSNLDLPDPQILVTHRRPRPWTEACFLHLEPAADVNPSGERKGEPGRALEPGEGCSRATELFNPTFLHYIGIPYVHFSFLTSHVNTCLPMWGALAGRRMFLYTSRWDRGRPGGFEVLLTPEGRFRRGGAGGCRASSHVFARVHVGLARSLTEARTSAHIHLCHLFFLSTDVCRAPALSPNTA